MGFRESIYLTPETLEASLPIIKSAMLSKSFGSFNLQPNGNVWLPKPKLPTRRIKNLKFVRLPRPSAAGKDQAVNFEGTHDSHLSSSR